MVTGSLPSVRDVIFRYLGAVPVESANRAHFAELHLFRGRIYSFERRINEVSPCHPRTVPLSCLLRSSVL